MAKEAVWVAEEKSPILHQQEVVKRVGASDAVFSRLQKRGTWQ